MEKIIKICKWSMRLLLIVEFVFLVLGIFKVTPMEFVYYAFVGVIISGVIGMTLTSIKLRKLRKLRKNDN